MSSFKQLSKADVTSVSYAANKQWTLPFTCPSISNDYFTIYKGTFITGAFNPNNYTVDPITNGQYERLVYDSINHLFYQKFSGSLDTGSLMFNINTYQSASQQRPTSSYFDYNTNPLLIKNFPTGANAGIRVLAINQDIYGSKVLPNSFNLSSSAYYITDDGNGNLFGSGSTHVGNIFYAQGLAIITNPDYQDMFPLPPVAVNNTATYLTSNSSVKTIPILANDVSRSCALDTGSVVLSGSNSIYYTVNSNGTITLNTSASGNYDVYYTVNSLCGNGCSLTSNKAKVSVNVIAVNPPSCITVEFYGIKGGNTFYYVECGTVVTSSLLLDDTDAPVQKCIDGGFGVSGSTNYAYIGNCFPATTPSGCSLYLLCGADKAPDAIFYYTSCSGAPVTESVGSTGGACDGIESGVLRCISGSVTLDPTTPWGSYSLISLNCGTPTPPPTSSYSASIYAKFGANTTNPTTASIYYTTASGGTGSYILLGNIWDDSCTNLGTVSVSSGTTIYVGITTGSVGVNFNASTTSSCAGVGATTYCGTSSMYPVVISQNTDISVTAKVVANILQTC
jgi:hypothetical protein